MAITKRGEGRWKRKRERQVRKKKADRGRTDEAKTDRTAERAAKIIKEEALKRVVHGLPGHVRRSWPKGLAEHVETETGLQFSVRITRSTGESVDHTAVVPHNVIISSTGDGRLRGIAGDIAARIILGVEKVEQEKELERDYLRWQESDLEARLGTGLVLDNAGEEVEQAMTAATKSTVFCVVCGAEDRDKYPEWGPCIHEEGK